jgi:phosphonoacetate hydrolase
MNAKHDENGQPNVIYLQDLLDDWIGAGNSRVILPITDPYVVHHGALGSYATVYLDQDVDRDALIGRLQSVPGVEVVYDNQAGCTAFGLANDRMGDIILVSTRHTVVGTSADRHDLSGLDVPLRSHGGISEQTVPLIFNGPVTGIEGRSRLRNFDIFDIALNHVTLQ